MADQSDVENALVTLATSAIYPNGTNADAVVGADCRIYRGWPQSAALDKDLAAGCINVTVFPAGEAGQNTTRYGEQWLGTAVAPGLTVEVLGNSVRFSGAAGAGQVAGLLTDNRSYAYRGQSGDTPTVVAAKLAALARADWFVQLTGATLVVPGAGRVLARVVADSTVNLEVRRQEQAFRITFWCPTPGARDVAAAAVDQALATLRFIKLPDGSCARLRYSGTAVFDQSQDALLYRRDLLYAAEYATIIRQLQPAMLFGDLRLNAAQFMT